MLQNIHLMQAWLKDLERALEVIEEFVHDEPRSSDRRTTDFKTAAVGDGWRAMV